MSDVRKEPGDEIVQDKVIRVDSEPVVIDPKSTGDKVGEPNTAIVHTENVQVTVDTEGKTSDEVTEAAEKKAKAITTSPENKAVKPKGK